MAARDEDPFIGARLGEYQILERIGEGGMGVVYRGIQLVLRKRVAIKVLKPEAAARPEQVQRLLDEARSANFIGHPGIVNIFGTGALSDGRHYLVMEYLEGRSLDRKLSDGGPFFLHEALPLLKEICTALAAAHARGIVHRDLKPSNVFVLDEPDGGRTVKLLDFGLAKYGSSPGEDRTGPVRVPRTGATSIVGTVEYMAPEQARAEPVSAKADLYSLGVLAFELLTGQLPFHGPSAMELLRHHLQTPAPPMSTRVEGLPPALDALVLQMMEKDPERRPASADAVRAALNDIEDGLFKSDTRRVGGGAAVKVKPVRRAVVLSEKTLARRRLWGRVAAGAALMAVSALAGALLERGCAGGQSPPVRVSPRRASPSAKVAGSGRSERTRYSPEAGLKSNR